MNAANRSRAVLASPKLASALSAPNAWAEMAVLVALSVLAQRLIELDDESATEVMDGPLDVLLMFETRWCKAMSKTCPIWPARARPRG